MTLDYRKIFAFGLALLLILTACGKKEAPTPIDPAPVGPFTAAELAGLNGAEEARFGVEYSVPDATQKISFAKAYRTKILATGSLHNDDGYTNAVVVELTATSMDEAQAAMTNRRTAYLANSENHQYYALDGYVMLHDPISHQIYAVYQTNVDIFDPEFRYLILGDFSLTGKTKLLFDLGDLLDFVNIAPFTPTQEMPDDEMISLLTSALISAIDDPNIYAPNIYILDGNKLAITAGVHNFESKDAAIETTQKIYKAVLSVFSVYKKRPDFFATYFCAGEDENEVVCNIGNPEIYRDPWGFAYTDLRTGEIYLFDLLPRPGSGSGSNYADITLAEFNKIQNGDSYSRVKKIVGGDGELLSTYTILDSTYESYAWYGADGISNAIVFFEGGAVYSKSQYGLP